MVQHRGGIGSGTTECMGEGLVLRSNGGDGVGCRDVGPLEVGGCKIRNAVTDGGGEFGNRLLNLGGVVIRLGVVCLGDPGGCQ